jgi:hypothetical protein
MEYSRMQTVVWEARERLDETMSHMTPEEIIAHANRVTDDWKRKMESKRSPERTARTDSGAAGSQS